MDARRLVFVTWIVACIAAACGGSGSSGFDAEGLAIGRALDTNRCLERDGLIICPNGKASPRRTPDEPPIVVSVGLDLSKPLGCVLEPSGDSCVSDLPLIVGGLPEEGELRMATRVVDAVVSWRVGDEVRLPPSRTRVTPPARFALAPGTSPGANVEVQIGILAFRVPASAVPADVDELAKVGADVVFVTRPFRIAVTEVTGAAPGTTGGGSAE